MADTIERTRQVRPPRVPEQAEQPRSALWQRLALGGIVLIAVFMDFFQLGQNGFGSYYPPAVRSMMDNWHNFFFASYDPGGFVTIDKPPLGFWLQVASAKLFGFNAVSILLPQALAGVLSVLLLYYLVRRHFGVIAGLLAALALALSPISVVTNRNITIDSTLALTLLVGAWAVLRAAETGRLRWLLLSAVMVAIGFNIKMMEAYLVVPAYAVLYLVAAPRSIWKRIGHLALAGLLLVVVSFSWAVAVDLTPASQRPYVGSTQDNSEISLALGYNGIDRLLRGFGGGFRGRPQGNTSNNTPPPTANRGTTGGVSAAQGNRTRQVQPPAGGFGGIFNTGAASPLRLFEVALGSQIAWLLPLALFSLLALAWQRRPNLQEDRKLQSLVFWGMWLLTMGTFFSVAGFFHQYYMTEMAPAIAALFGIGLVTMWQDYRRGDWRGWLLPLALAATVAEQVYILSAYPTWGRWMIPLIIALSVVAVGVLVGVRIAPHLRVKVPTARFILPVLGAGVLALMLAPTVWAITPILLSKQADTLVAGPPQTGDGGGNFARFGRNNDTANTNSVLLHYLQANQGNTKFLVAVPSSMMADSIILATNKPVMAMGGFSGGDPILTTSQLAALVKNGTVRFFLLSVRIQLPSQILNQLPQQFRNRLRGGFSFGGFQQSALTTWVTQHCKTVPTSLWQFSTTSASSGGDFGSGGSNQLYDCAVTH
ncbi:MAG: glycosyltransferase family 39 protein [Chloroflexi bacterium]|nr:glycosyltransferase family 39 protein [Ktedonobacteraceae bacterium]MBV9708274.1 glycosyltransferase family 39 protein [Chloroflexota bacterium]